MFIKNKKKKINYIINVKEKILGRISSFISNILTGKNEEFIKNNILILNKKKIHLNKKKYKKLIFKHTKYPGGLKSLTFKEMYKKNINKIYLNSVKNMLKLRNNKIKNYLKFIENLNKERKYKNYKILNNI